MPNSNACACVYFGGFRQNKFKEACNAFSEWVKQFSGRSNLTLLLNLWLGNTKDTLRTRWERFASHLPRLCASEADVYVLSYSLGCHLAVRFAADALLRDRVRSLDFVAPDPKFCRTPPDNHETPSAFDEAKEFWGTDGRPGDCFSDNLEKLVTPGSNPRVHLLCSEEDEVAVWKDNVELIERRFPNAFNWYKVSVGKDRSNGRDSRWEVKLCPGQASSEFWIHEQLFANAKWHAGKKPKPRK
jgi:hypothetical protein